MPFYQNLSTDRLILRLPKRSDIKPIYNYQKDKRNYPFADLYSFKNIKEAEDFLDSIVLKIKKHDLLFWVIEDKKNKTPVGTLSAWNIDIEKNSIEFGYHVFPEFRGKGYMVEAIRQAMKYLHHELGFAVFDIWTDKDNIPSIKIAKKLDFKFTGYVEEKAHHSDTIITYATHQLRYLDEKGNNFGKI